MRTHSLLLPLAAALLLSACGASSGTPQDANVTQTAPQDSNGTAAQNSNGAAPQGGNSVTGTVQGHGLAAKSAIYAVGEVAGQDGNTKLLILWISDTPDPCAAVTQKAHSRNSTSLKFVLFAGDANGNTVAPTAGTYSVSSGSATSLMAGQAELFVYDATCQSTLQDDAATASTGTVGITSVLVDGTTPLVGTFNLGVGPQGDMLAGAFSATGCPALIQVAASGSAGGTCQ